jgi:hypothetical protein
VRFLIAAAIGDQERAEFNQGNLFEGFLTRREFKRQESLIGTSELIALPIIM